MSLPDDRLMPAEIARGRRVDADIQSSRRLACAFLKVCAIVGGILTTTAAVVAAFHPFGLGR